MFAVFVLFQVIGKGAGLKRGCDPNNWHDLESIFDDKVPIKRFRCRRLVKCWTGDPLSLPSESWSGRRDLIRFPTI